MYHINLPYIKGTITRFDEEPVVAYIGNYAVYIKNLRPTKYQVIKDFIEATKTL